MAPRSCFAGKKREQSFEEGLADPGGEIPKGLAGRRGDEGGGVEPFEAMVAGGVRPPANRCPDPPDDRLQPDPVLVGGEDVDRAVGRFAAFFLVDRPEFFLKAAASSGVASLGLDGRGTWIDQAIAFNRSQPR